MRESESHKKVDDIRRSITEGHRKRWKVGGVEVLSWSYFHNSISETPTHLPHQARWCFSSVDGGGKIECFPDGFPTGCHVDGEGNRKGVGCRASK